MKKALLLAGGGFYLGSLRLPTQSREYWARNKKAGDSTSLRVTKAVLFVGLTPVLTPVEGLLKVTGHHDRVLTKLRHMNAVLKFKTDLNAYEREQEKTL